MPISTPKRSSNWNYGGNNWKLSRSKIELFMQCPRCFYLDNKLGIRRPSMPAFLLNSAVDSQLKKEFDVHRAKGTKHPFQDEYGIDAVPAQHEKINTWRENFEGVQYFHEPTGLLVSGAIDDLWLNSQGEYIVVDYKATAKDAPVKELSGIWHEGYKRQMEIYQWLLRNNDLKVSDTGYFVYCTGKADQEAFDKTIEFDVVLIPYTGKADWVEGVLFKIKDCLDSAQIPNSGPDCEYCGWYYARASEEGESVDTKPEPLEKPELKTKIARKTLKPKKLPDSSSTPLF